MANYRFKTAEIEAMKKNILTQIEREVETKTAWRLRCAIEGQLMCCRPSKRKAARLERELALYEKLTKNDLPNWQIEPTQPATPTETPQISTEAAETVNVSAEGEKGAETRENTPKRKIQYFHYTPEQLKRYIIDVYEKNANGEWVLLPYKQIDTDKCFWNVINGKIGEWDRMQERFTEVNMDFNSPTCGRCFKINRTYQQDYFIVSNEKLLEFTINGNYYYIQKQTYSKGKHRWCYTIMDAYGDFAVDDFSYTKRGIMQRFNKWWKKNATIIWQASETPTEPPQSPETPQTVECATDAPKPRETTQKRPNRAIGSAQHHQYSALGANGYSVLNDASMNFKNITVTLHKTNSHVSL